MNAVLRPAAIFYHRECVADVLEEIKPLLMDHYREIAHYQDIALDPDYDFYKASQERGLLRIFTARADDRLIGYAIYFVARSHKYRSSIQATQDILFLHPDYRRGGTGYRLIEFADSQLRSEGVQVVIQHVKAIHDFGSLLTRMGYELQDLYYTRRLD